MSLPHALAVENTQSEQQSILIMGDSISAGFGIDKEKGWVNLLTNRLNTLKTTYNVINASISGETTRGGANRIKTLLAQHSPNIVIIELGGNDGLRGSPIKGITKNLNYMIQQSQNSGAKVLLLGMQIPPNYGESYSRLFAQQYKKLALERNVTLIPFFLEGYCSGARYDAS